MKLNNNITVGVIALAAITVVSMVLARSLSGSQTLAEYARENGQLEAGADKTAEIDGLEADDSSATESEKSLGVGSETSSVAGSAVESGKSSVAGSVAESGKSSVASGSSGEDSNGGSSTYNKENVGKSGLSESGHKGSGESDVASSTQGGNMKVLNFVDEYAGTDMRIEYKDGFFYEPVPQVIREKMKGVSYPLDIDESRISYNELRYLNILYVDFDGNTQIGELVCNELIAKDLVEIFYELYRADYRLERVRLIDEYNADDVLSMSDNNTSSFCYRVIDGTDRLSNHAYGMAIDINPFYNPYIVFKSGQEDYISPPGSEIYADRSEENPNPYRIDKNDLAYKLFKEHGFRWGGDWNSSKDYQHFDKKIN